MANLRDVIAYILQKYPHKLELSNARVTKMIYLADWKHALERGQQATDISWFFDNYGPFVWDIKNTVDHNPQLFRAEHTANVFGGAKVLLECVDKRYVPALSESEREAIDHVIATTSPLTWDKFIGLVYSTFPIVSSERYSRLDLVAAATAYRRSPVFHAVTPR